MRALRTQVKNLQVVTSLQGNNNCKKTYRNLFAPLLQRVNFSVY